MPWKPEGVRGRKRDRYDHPVALCIEPQDADRPLPSRDGLHVPEEWKTLCEYDPEKFVRHTYSPVV